MRKKVQTTLLFLLILTTDLTLGKSNKTKSNKTYHKNHNTLKERLENERIKRSLDDDNDRPFWPNRGKKQLEDDPNYNTKYDDDEYNKKVSKSSDKLLKEQPFWGSRGRRDNSVESFLDYEYPEYPLKHCYHCVDYPTKVEEFKNNKERREDFISPFWGNRGRRNSLEVEDIDDPFWGNRGRRMEEEKFWGNRGRRFEYAPFWGNRGRREEEPFWGNRGRRDEMGPFWGNRGRRQDSEPFWGNRGRRQDSEPFWGNRGRRQENEQFWGSRGRRDEEPFWGNRGRRKESEQGNAQIRKEDLKDSILTAINDVETDIEHLSRLKKNVDSTSFWANRGRDNKLSLLFNQPSRNRGLQSNAKTFHSQNAEPGTVLDNKMYVDEPNYILVERTGRSSGEVDPYYISRGKKYYLNYSMEKAARDRRGAIEEIVKSVRNDPYYIARGKKDILKNGNSTLINEEYNKAKELICAAIELIMIKNDGDKFKREISDNERNRRNTLKKLAAQLQVDPYFVSRGKKDDVNSKDYLQDFISNVAEKCN